MGGVVYTAGYSTPLLGVSPYSGVVVASHTNIGLALTFNKIVRGGDYNYPGRIGITEDGKLYYWGYKFWVSSPSIFATPTQETTYTDWVDIAATDRGIIGIRSNGGLYSIGISSSGELGRGSNGTFTTWAQVGLATDWLQVAGSAANCFAINVNNELWGCGTNGARELCTGDTTSRTSLVRVGTGTFLKVSPCSYSFVLAIGTDGKLYAWGFRSNYQIDSGSSGTYATPTEVHPDNDWVGVTATIQGSIAVKSNGAVYCTGINHTFNSSSGTLGMGATAIVTGWTLNPNINGVAQVLNGQHQTFFIKTNGDVYASGYNSSYGLGTGNNTSTTTPVQIFAGSKTLAMPGSIGYNQQHTHYASYLVAEGPLACAVGTTFTKDFANLSVATNHQLSSSDKAFSLSAITYEYDYQLNSSVYRFYLTTTGPVLLVSQKDFSLRSDYAWPQENNVLLYGGSVGSLNISSIVLDTVLSASVNILISVTEATFDNPALLRKMESSRSFGLSLTNPNLLNSPPAGPVFAASANMYLNNSAVLGVGGVLPGASVYQSLMVNKASLAPGNEVQLVVDPSFRPILGFVTGKLVDELFLDLHSPTQNWSLSTNSPTLIYSGEIRLQSSAAYSYSPQKGFNLYATAGFVNPANEIQLASDSYFYINYVIASLGTKINLSANHTWSLRIPFAVLNPGGKYSTVTLSFVSGSDLPFGDNYGYDYYRNVTISEGADLSVVSIEAVYVRYYYDQYSWPGYYDPPSSSTFTVYPRFLLSKIGDDVARLDSTLSTLDDTEYAGEMEDTAYRRRFELLNKGDDLLPYTPIASNPFVGTSIQGTWRVDPDSELGSFFDHLLIYDFDVVLLIDPDLFLEGEATMSMTAVGYDNEYSMSASVVLSLSLGDVLEPTANLYNVSQFGFIENAGETINHDLVFTKNNVNITQYVFGDYSISKERDAARLAEFTYKIPTGVYDPYDFIGQTIEVDYVLYVADSPFRTYRLFTGIVQRVDVSADLTWVKIYATDDLQATIDAMANEGIVALTPTALWSHFLFDKDAKGWEYLQDRLSTCPQSVDKDAYGNLMYYGWFADPEAYYTFGIDDDVVDSSVTVEVADRDSIFNKYNIEFKYRYPRLGGRRRCFYWTYQGPWADYGPSYNMYDYPLYGLDMHSVINAIDAGGWVVDGYRPVPSNDNYMPVYNVWFKAHRKYTRRLTETYSLVVTSPESIAKHGVIETDFSYSGEVEFDESAWMDNDNAEPVMFGSTGDLLPNFSSSFPDTYGDYGRSQWVIGGNQDRYDIVYDVVNQDTDGEEQLANGVKAAIGHARREMIKAHSGNKVTLKSVAIFPVVETTQTIGIEVDTVQARGRVVGFTHSGSMDEGTTSHTEIVLAMMRGNPSGPVTEPTLDFQFTRTPFSPPTAPNGCTELPHDVRIINSAAPGYSSVEDMFDWERDGLTAWMTGPYLVSTDNPSTPEWEDTVIEWHVERAQFKVTYPDIEEADSENTELPPTVYDYRIAIPNDPFTIVAL